MSTSTVLSTQLVPFCLRSAKLDEPLIEKIVEGISDADFEKLSAMLAEVLRDEAGAGNLKMTDPSNGQPATLKSILYKADADSGKTLKVVAFSFSTAAHESLVTLFGLAVTAFFGQLTLGSLGSGLSLLKTLWSNLSLLRSPQDDNAIAVVYLDTFGTFAGLSMFTARMVALRRFVEASGEFVASNVFWQLPMSKWVASGKAPDAARRLLRVARAFRTGTDVFLAPFAQFAREGTQSNLGSMCLFRRWTPKGSDSFLTYLRFRCRWASWQRPPTSSAHLP